MYFRQLILRGLSTSYLVIQASKSGESRDSNLRAISVKTIYLSKGTGWGNLWREYTRRGREGLQLVLHLDISFRSKNWQGNWLMACVGGKNIAFKELRKLKKKCINRMKNSIAKLFNSIKSSSKMRKKKWLPDLST